MLTENNRRTQTDIDLRSVEYLRILCICFKPNPSLVYDHVMTDDTVQSYDAFSHLVFLHIAESTLGKQEL